MKKTTLFVALAVAGSAAFAQDLTSSKGEKYLPETGDWSIGFSALPVINTFGHLLNGNPALPTALGNPYGAMGGNTSSTNYIVGKYFVDDKTAFRGVLGINVGSTTQNFLTPDVTYTGSGTPPNVTDTWKQSQTSIAIGAGYEKRKGTTRLQGYYGAMLMLDFGNSGKNTYTYGNSLSSTNTTHTQDFGQSQGLLTNNGGTMFGLGLNGFIGAEYFIVPKISIGAEFWWGIGFSSTGQGSMTSEKWTTSLQSTTTNTGGNSSFSLGNNVSAVMINFHF